MSATDADSGEDGMITFSLDESSRVLQRMFAVDESSGVITLLSSVESSNSHILIISASSRSRRTSTRVTVTISGTSFVLQIELGKNISKLKF